MKQMYKIESAFRGTKSIIFIVFACLFAMQMSVMAQNSSITLPYSMGFEDADSTEFKANWHLNPGANADKANDKWIVGRATSVEGSNSMYITTNGRNAQFGNKPCIQYAYGDFDLPQGSYTLSFAWRAIGSDKASLYVGVGTPSLNLAAATSTIQVSNGLPTAIENAVLLSDLHDQTAWKQEDIDIAVPNSQIRVFFAWVNKETDTTKISLGACIDNFVITANTVKAPKDLAVDVRSCDSIVLSWRGSSERYQVEWRVTGGSVWYQRNYEEANFKSENQITLSAAEGSYDFRVCGKQGDDVSAWTYLNNFSVLCPENHCINFMDLHNTDVVQGTIGTYANPYQTKGITDLGQYDQYSRQTVCWEQGFDPRTKNKLKYIPDGEQASVRLGNWNINAQAESLTYPFYVDAQGSAILLLKYAVVLENPSEHSENENPMFELDILDEDGRTLINTSCGHVNVVAGFGETTQWHSTCDDADEEDDPYDDYWDYWDYWYGYGGYGYGGYGSGYGSYGCSNEVLWKDWTTIGLNLTEYDGKTLSIRVTTRDCSLSGHYGYAYFTLACAKATIDHVSCGSDILTELKAPEGFNYTWYDSTNKIVGNEQIMSISASDTTTYRCRLSYKENDGCYFDLTTSSEPRVAHADFDTKYIGKDCKNTVKLINNSYITFNYDWGVKAHPELKCEDYEWRIQTPTNVILSSQESPEIEFPAQGGDFKIELSAYIGNGACRDTLVRTIHLDPVGDMIQYIDTTICQGNYIEVGNTFLMTEGHHELGGLSQAGCDSMYVVDLHISDTTVTRLDTVIICHYEAPYCVTDSKRDTTFCYDGKSKNLEMLYQNRYGCDSLLVQHVIIKNELRIPNMDLTDESDIPESGSIIFEEGSGKGYDYYIVNGVRDMDLSALTGGTYIIEFVNDSLGHQCVLTDTINLAYGCVSHVVYQRWDDVLSIYNKDKQEEVYDKRPAYDYVGFQWLKDGVKIPGATSSYYYEQGGLDFNAIYTCLLTREDGTEKETCEFQPAPYPATVSLMPQIVEPAGTLTVRGEVERIEVVDAHGLIVERIEGAVSSLTAPTMQGLYFYRLTNTEGEQKTFRVMVGQ